ncbi:MAG: beta-galactosidase [Chloroflexi bacterium]|nr:beta-galactosidase [Chloroflexota bacterium]
MQGKFDFSALDQQIEYAEKHHLKLALICEINPFYAPAWLKEKVKAAGQNVKNSRGADGDIPSITSPIFRQAEEQLIRKTIEFIGQRDTNHVVEYYHPGAEWWFPHSYRYNAADIAQFRLWLQAHYRSLGELNAAWRSEYRSFDDVPAPRIDTIPAGKQDLAKVLSLDLGAEHCSWSTAAATDPAAVPGAVTFAKVEPGKTYVFSAWVKADDIRGPGAFLEIAWIGPDGGAPSLPGAVGKSIQESRGWHRASLVVRAPKGAGRFWLLLKMAGTGTVTFSDVELRAEGSAVNIAPNPAFESGDGSPIAWSFQNWTGLGRAKAEYLKSDGHNGQRAVRISVPVVGNRTATYRNHAAAVNDWTEYWYEAAARYINSLASAYKRLAPARKTVTYLTFSFAFPAEWDYTQEDAISPDEVAIQGNDIDVFGMQLCAADGDPYRVTACLDLMRKYGKPLWAVDLVDFTSGVPIGYPAMDKVTQSAIQHDASGLIYCCWHLPSVLDYSFYPHMDMKDVNRMLTDARAAIKLVDGMKIHPKVALVQPILPASPDDRAGMKNDFRSFMGWYKVLESMHQTFDVVTLREIEKGAATLTRYEWLLLPDCAYLPRTVIARRADFAKSGGHLLTAGRFAQFDEIGRPQDPTETTKCSRVTLADFGKSYTGTVVRDTHAGNTPPLFLWRKDTPETQRALADARAVLHTFFKSANINESVQLSPDDSAIRCVVFEGPRNLAAYLVNISEKPIDGGRLELRLKSAEKGVTGVTVYADTKPVDCRHRTRRGTVHVDLPGFRTSCIVKVAQ